MSETEESELISSPRSHMSNSDWDDIKESEFKNDPAFVFEHPEIGHHEFVLNKETGVLEPQTFEKVGEDE